MAGTVTINRSAPGAVVRTLAAPFVAVGRFLVLLGEAHPKMRALDHLGRISDRELAERGLTRDGEMRRIMGVSAL